MKTALIQYIGRAAPRPDDVLKTDRVWHKINDVVEVPEDQAGYYTQHALEWRLITPTEAQQREEAKKQVARLVERIKVEWEPMTVEDLQSLRAEIDERIEAIKTNTVVAASKPTPPPPVVNATDQLNSEDAATRELGRKKIEAIARTLGTMDPKDKDQWSVRGPRVAEVTMRHGEKVSAEEVAEALKLTEIHRLEL